MTAAYGDESTQSFVEVVVSDALKRPVGEPADPRLLGVEQVPVLREEVAPAAETHADGPGGFEQQDLVVVALQQQRDVVCVRVGYRRCCWSGRAALSRRSSCSGRAARLRGRPSC